MILTRKQLAEKLQVHVTTIDNYERKGMPVLRVKKIDPRYNWEEILKWLSGKEAK